MPKMSPVKRGKLPTGVESHQLELPNPKRPLEPLEVTSQEMLGRLADDSFGAETDKKTSSFEVLVLLGPSLLLAQKKEFPN